MQLLRIKAANIFSIGEVELDLDSRGLVLVTGFSEDEGDPNGAGKSSIANRSILWGLYGRTANGLKGDSVVNRHLKEKEEAFAEITFEAVDGNLYVLRRSRQPNQLTLRRVDGLDLTQRKESETQELLDRLLGRGYDTFVQTCLFGQGKGGSFATLTPTAQKAILEEILPMGLLSEWGEKAKACRRAAVEKLESLSNAFGRTSAAQNAFADQLKAIEASIISFEENRQSEVQRIRLLREQIQKNLDAAMGVEAQLRKQIADVEAVTVNMPALEQAFAAAKQAYDAADYNEIQTEYRLALAAWHKVREEVQALEGSNICITCKRPMPNAEELAAHVESHKKEMDRLDQVAVALLEKVNAAKEKRNTLGVSKTNAESALNVCRDLQRKAAALEKQLFEVNREKYQTALQHSNESERQLQEQENPYAKQVKPISDRIAALDLELENGRVKIDQLKKERDAASWWENAYFRDLRLALFDRVKAYLGERARAHLQGLGNAQISVEFNTVRTLASGEMREEFTVEVVSETGGSGFQSMSGGEQQLIGFAIGLALADLAELRASGSCNLMILDEPLENLGPKNSEALVAYLSKMQEKGTILMISNDETLKGLVPNRIHVVKSGGVSRLSEEA